MSDRVDQTTVAAITDLARKSMAVENPMIMLSAPPPGGLAAAGQRIMLIVPDGKKAEDITDKLLATLPHPRERAGTVVLTSLASFAGYVNRMKEESSVLFADMAADHRKIVCVFDYHEAVNHEALASSHPAAGGQDAEGDVTAVVHVPADMPLPRWGRFKASYAFPHTEAWRRWSEKNKQAMSQGELAHFIEDNIEDILDVDPANPEIGDKAVGLINQLGLKLSNRAGLIAAARGLELTISENVASVVNTSNGEVQIKYDQSHMQNGAPAQQSVPSAFVLALQVFEGGAAYKLLVRLRYRKDGPGLKWWYDIYSLNKALEDAFTRSCEDVRDQTGLPLFFASLIS